MNNDENAPTVKYYDTVYDNFKGSDVTNAEIYLFKRYAIEYPRILDLCCGTGRHFVPLAEQGYDIVGLDVSGDMLKQLRNKTQKGEIVKMNFLNETRDLGKFDLIICMWNGICELARYDKELYRVLNKLKGMMNKQACIVINVDDITLIDFSAFDYTYKKMVGNDEYESNFKLISFDELNKVTICKENISINGNSVAEANITQKWWGVAEMEQAAKRAGLNLKREHLKETNEEYYIFFNN